MDLLPLKKLFSGCFVVLLFLSSLALFLCDLMIFCSFLSLFSFWEPSDAYTGLFWWCPIDPLSYLNSFFFFIFLNLKKNFNFIYFLFLAALGLHCCMQAFSSCSEWELTLRCGARASHCSGFSCCRAQALGMRASVVVVRRPSSCGAWA